MSIAAIRDAFNVISLAKGLRCTSALLNYCDAKGTSTGKRDHQQLVFNCVRSADNTTPQYTSDVLPGGTNAIAAAQAVAQKAIGAA
jgi:hypothetical protein